MIYVPTGRAEFMSTYAPPTVPASVVDRPRLVDDAAWSREILLVSAPAGYGKTVLLAQRHRLLVTRHRPVAWMTLAAHDGVAMGLWTQVVTALSTGYGSAGQPELAERLGKIQVDASLTAVDDVVEMLVASGSEFTLMIDDAHELRSGPESEALVRMTESVPGAQLVLAGRWDPPIRWSRLVIAGAATQLRADALSLNADEAREMLGRNELDIDDDGLRVLLTRTEGWAAGLQLATIALRSIDDPTSYGEYLTSFAGDARPVADYLVAEILACVPTDVLDVMRATAVAGHVTVDLAVRLAGRDDAGRVLDELVAMNLLIMQESSDPLTYRYHALLRGYLLADGARRDLSAQRRHFVTAARWAEENQHPESAIEYLVRAQDWEGLVGAITDHGLEVALQGSGHLVDQAMAKLPDDFGARRDVVLLTAALAAVAGRARTLDGALAVIGDDPMRESTSTHRVLHATVLLMRSVLGHGPRQDIDRLLDVVVASHEVSLAVHTYALAAAGKALAFNDHYDRADAVLTRARGLAEAGGYRLLALDCLSHLVLTAGGRGDFVRLREYARAARESAATCGWTRLPLMAATYGVGAWAAWRAADDTELDVYLALERRISGDVAPHAALGRGLLAAYRTHLGTGDHRVMRAATARVWDEFDLDMVAPQAYVVFVVSELAEAVYACDAEWLAEIADRSRHILTAGDVEVVAAAHRLISGDAAGTLTIVQNSSTSQDYLQLWAHLLAVVALQRMRRTPAAVEQLLAALELGERIDARRPFLQAPVEVSALLTSMGGRLGTSEAFAAPIADALGPVDDAEGPVIQQLTPRERAILRDLPSDLTVAEIASARMVSENTIRTQLKAIYRKLNVKSRRDAVRRAHKLGLV
ncbi:LuxR C-terminal-related transcriptional regulator [Gordonia sp. DT30]|uniref:LuxR C-terminal-related transcriptional regulator n=1 Tax=unclassified Gordonia (in: high G+C Gram-positive bacteria) TaxID=2657482 RepID=UPI003CE83D34